MKWYELLIMILSGMATCLPLVISFSKNIYTLIKEKKWGELITIIIQYMQAAETEFDNGAARKEWVMSMLKTSAEVAKYNINVEELSDLIDKLCSMSKIVNVPKAEE